MPEEKEGEQKQQEAEETKGERSVADALAESLKKMNERLEALAKKQDQLAPKPEKKKSEVKPPEPLPPSGVTAAQRNEYLRRLEEYAAAKAQEAERLRLAQQFGLDPEELEGQFDSPAQMRQYAELLSLRKQVATLEERLREEREAEKRKEDEEEKAKIPRADTGGPTGVEGERTELEELYERAKKLGRTPKGRQTLLEALYRDPEKRRPFRRID